MDIKPKTFDKNTVIRILMVGDFPKNIDSIGGGVESVMLYLCEYLGPRNDVELSVVTLDRWGLGQRTVDYGTYIAHYVPQSRARGPLKRRINVRRLRNIIVELQPDIVHAQMAGHYSFAAYASGKPYVLTLHGVGFLEANIKSGLVNRYYRRHMVRRKERVAIEQAKNVISINPFIDESFRGKLNGRIRHIENPIADGWFDIDADGDEFGLLYAGRITPRKDIFTLLKAFQQFHMKYPAARLRIAGAPDDPDPTGYFDELKVFVRNAGLEQSVSFLGSLTESQLMAEYGRNAFFVIASVLETAPMSIAQAQAAGRIIVSTDAGGCRHMIHNRVSGMVVPIGDAAAFAAALIECVENRSLREALRTRTRIEAKQRYKAKIISDATLDFYREVLANN